MASRSRDFDLDLDNPFRTAPPRRTKMSKGFFSFENPGFVLVLYNFLFALPLCYALTRLNKYTITLIGYEKIMRCPSGILFSRSLFVALNMWLVVGWGLQLEREARARRIARVGNDIAFWEGEVDRLKGLLGRVRQLEVEEQFRRECPTSASTSIYYRSAHGTAHSSTPSHNRYSKGRGKWNGKGLFGGGGGGGGNAACAAEHWRAADEEGDEDEEGSEDDVEDDDNEDGDEEGDSEWNGDD